MKILYTLLLVGLLPLAGLNAQTVTLDFESGNRDLDMSNCWDNSNIHYVDRNVIQGSWSGQTSQIKTENYDWIFMKSPWVLPASGSIEFQVRLSGGSANSRAFKVFVVPYSASGVNGEGAVEEIYFYEFSNPRSTALVDVSVPMPSSWVNAALPVRVKISFLGQGGSGSAYLDNISVPGVYASDPSRGCIPVMNLNDADLDGVEDDEDMYPDDPYRAFNNYFPSATGFATLLFEDKWPGKGDYDFNDLVLSYRINSITNAENQVVEQKYTFVIRAIGAWYRNGFGFQLMGVSPSSVLDISGTDVSGIPYLVPGTEYVTVYDFETNGLESGQTHPTVIVMDDAFRVVGTENILMNTDLTLPVLPAKTLNVGVVFMENGVAGPGGPVTLNQLTIPQFNPFMVINGDRRREVHQAHFLPTDLAVTTVFGMIDDASDPEEGIYYVTSMNHPWVLNIPEEIPYPVELLQLDQGYLKFLDWVQSGGTQYPDWYMDKPGYRDNTALY